MSLSSELAAAVASEIEAAQITPGLSASFVALPRQTVATQSGIEVYVSPDYIKLETHDRARLTKWKCGLVVAVLKALTSKQSDDHRNSEIADCEDICEKIAQHLLKHPVRRFHSHPTFEAGIVSAAFKPLFAVEYVNGMNTFGAYGEFEYFFFTN